MIFLFRRSLIASTSSQKQIGETLSSQYCKILLLPACTLSKKNLRVAQEKINEAQKHGTQCLPITLPYLEIRIPYLEMRVGIHFVPMHSFANTYTQYASRYHDTTMRCHANRASLPRDLLKFYWIRDKHNASFS